MAPSYDAASLFTVKGLVAVITGAGSGLGKIYAHALVANGAKAVFILGRRAEALQSTKSSSTNPSAIHPIECDVTSKESLQAAADKVSSAVGYINVLFANSGVLSACTPAIEKLNRASSVQDVQKALWEPSEKEYAKSFEVNVAGAYFSAVAFLGLLDAGNRKSELFQDSQIIVTSSVAGFARTSVSGYAYGPSKAAATHLSKQLATLLAPVGVRVNIIAPGIHPSEMADSVELANGKNDIREKGALPDNIVPMRRSGHEEEVGGIVVFMTSKAGGYLDGNVVLTDGGRLSIQPATY